jgi:putative pyruvate formate lyase activating enzyme
MVRLKGFLEPWDSTGGDIARHGVLVRHLVLPGHVENSLEVLRLLHREFGRGLPISVMSQFCPVPECAKQKDFHRGITSDEYDQVLGVVEELGFEKVYAQELKGETAFLPDFENPENPFPGNRE